MALVSNFGQSTSGGELDDALWLYAVFVLEEDAGVTPSMSLNGQELEKIGTWRTDADPLGVATHTGRPALSLHLYTHRHYGGDADFVTEIIHGGDGDASMAGARIVMNVFETNEDETDIDWTKDWTAILAGLDVQVGVGTPQIGSGGSIDNPMEDGRQYAMLAVMPAEHYRTIMQPVPYLPAVYENADITIGPGETSEPVAYEIPDELWNAEGSFYFGMQRIRVQIGCGTIGVTGQNAVPIDHPFFNPAIMDPFTLEYQLPDGNWQALVQPWAVWDGEWNGLDHVEEFRYSFNEDPITELNPRVPKTGFFRFHNHSGAPYHDDFTYSVTGFNFYWSGANSAYVSHGVLSTEGVHRYDGTDNPYNPSYYPLFGTDVALIPRQPWTVALNVAMFNDLNVPEAFDPIWDNETYVIPAWIQHGPERTHIMSGNMGTAWFDSAPYDTFSVYGQCLSSDRFHNSLFYQLDYFTDQWYGFANLTSVIGTSISDLYGPLFISDPIMMVPGHPSVPGDITTWRLGTIGANYNPGVFPVIPPYSNPSTFYNWSFGFYGHDSWAVRIDEYETDVIAVPLEGVIPKTTYITVPKRGQEGTQSFLFDPKTRFFGIGLVGYRGLYSNISVDIEAFGPELVPVTQRQGALTYVQPDNAYLVGSEPGALFGGYFARFGRSRYGYMPTMYLPGNTVYSHPPASYNPEVGNEIGGVSEVFFSYENPPGGNIVSGTFMSAFYKQGSQMAPPASDDLVPRPVNYILMTVTAQPVPGVPSGASTAVIDVAPGEPAGGAVGASVRTRIVG